MVSRSPLPVQIRWLTPNDAILPSVQVLSKATLGPTDMREELDRPFARAWVACVDGCEVPAGFIVTWLVADELHVLSVATTPAFRRRGVALALMRQALGFARGNAVRLVLLEVRRTNIAAIRLYRALGFTVMGVRKEYYADNGEDALEMMLVLDPETGQIVPGRDEVRLEEV